jgi:hypothetical protein
MAQRVPASLRWFLALIVLGTGIRLWAATTVPVLDVSDRGELRAALLTGVAMAFVARYATRGRDLAMGNAPPYAVTAIVALLGFSLGALLGSGFFLAGNALLDRTPVQWTAFTVEGHPRGRNGSRLELREYRADGSVHEVWMPDTRATAGLAIGEKVEVPVRLGAFGSAWQQGEIRAAP